MIPLAIGSYKRSVGLVPEVIMRDMYLEADKSGISPDKTLRIQRPGLTRTATYTGPLRGIHYRAATKQHIVVANTAIYANGVQSGSVPGSGKAIMTSTAFATLILADARAYIYDTTATPLLLPDDAPNNGYVQDLEQLNGYGLLLQPNGRFYWLVPGATSIDPLNFATAESLPDAAVAIIRLGDEFWIFGQQNVEVWQPTGDQDIPFQRASGRNFERGCLHREAVQRFDNTVVWIGDDFQVYRASSVPQVISDSGITERIRRATNECYAYTFGTDGHSFYVLVIPGEGVFAYDASSQAWSEFTWALDDAYQVDGVVVAASNDGRVYKVDPENTTDDGVGMSCTITATVPLIGKTPRNDSLAIGVGASADTTLRLRWKDGQDDYPAYYDELEVRAPFDVAEIRRLGQPEQPYRTFEISHTGAARIRIAGAVANEAWA